MNAKTLTLPLLIAAMALAACGGGEEPPTVTEVTVTETVPAPVAEEVVAETSEPQGPETSAEVGADLGTPTEEEAAAADETEETATASEETEKAEESAEDTTVDYGEPVLSQRGGLVKEVGQPAGIQTPEGEDLVVFTLTDIETNYQCESSMADPSQNGQYVAFTFEIVTSPDLSQDDEPLYGSFGISEWDLTAFSTDGKRENDISGNAMWCLDSADSLPYDIGPGQTVEGKIVIDTALDEGVLVYELMSFDGNHTWEWAF